MKVLITGANGYIGNQLVKSFIRKYDVTALTRKDCDLSSYKEIDKWFAKKTYDVVIHTAACGGNRLKTDTSEILDQNLQMYYNLLSQKDRYNKFIYFGSGAEIYSANTPYGFSKAVIAESVKDKSNFYNIRIYAVFNENEDQRRFIKSNIKRYIKNESLLIHENKKMDFFYMKDLVNLVEYYITNDNLPKFIDCSYKKTYTLFEIANMINNLGNYKCEIITQKNTIGQDYSGMYTPLLEYCGLEKGIKEVYKHLTS